MGSEMCIRDSNGPTLVFTENPVGLTTNHQGSVTLSGFATAVFPEGQTERSSNTGSIVYQWYKDNAPLTDDSIIVGSATTTVTISNLINPDDASSNFFLRADYIPSAYANGTTGNAVIDPKDSNVATVITAPKISVSLPASTVTVSYTHLTLPTIYSV